MMWRMIRHENILPLFGVTVGGQFGVMSGHQLATITEWSENGDITQFAKAHPDVNRLALVCFPLFLLDIMVDAYTTTAACRRYQGVDVYARPRNSPRKSCRGVCSKPTSPPACS